MQASYSTQFGVRYVRTACTYVRTYVCTDECKHGHIHTHFPLPYPVPCRGTPPSLRLCPSLPEWCTPSGGAHTLSRATHLHCPCATCVDEPAGRRSPGGRGHWSTLLGAGHVQGGACGGKTCEGGVGGSRACEGGLLEVGYVYGGWTCRGRICGGGACRVWCLGVGHVGEGYMRQVMMWYTRTTH